MFESYTPSNKVMKENHLNIIKRYTKELEKAKTKKEREYCINRIEVSTKAIKHIEIRELKEKN